MTKRIEYVENEADVLPNFIEQVNYIDNITFYPWFARVYYPTSNTVAIWKIKPKTIQP